MRGAAPGLLLGCLVLATEHCAAANDAPPPAEEARVQDIRQQLESLNWIHGPQHVPLFDNAGLDVPAGYMFLNPVDTAKLQSITHNIGGGTQYFLAPEDFHWEAFFDFRDDGYVKDDEKIDADSVLDSIRKGTEAANKERRERGWDEMTVIGWQTPPHYDTQTKRLEWAVSGRDLKTGQDIVNFNTRILGRAGVTSVVLISSPATLTGSITEVKAALTGFDYQAGQRYAEYRPGDRIAKYGLAALVTGGAAAIAVKTGFWKVAVGAIAAAWKFIVAGIVALFAGLKNRFKRRTP